MRSHDVKTGLQLRQLGVRVVVPETLEPALKLGAFLLRELDHQPKEVADMMQSFKRKHLSDVDKLDGEEKKPTEGGEDDGEVQEGNGNGSGGGTPTE